MIIDKDHPDADVLLKIEEIQEEQHKRMVWMVLIVVALVVIGLLSASYMYYNYKSKEPYRQVCERNPTQRYAQSCNGADECMTKCIERLMKEEHNNG